MKKKTVIILICLISLMALICLFIFIRSFYTSSNQIECFEQKTNSYALDSYGREGPKKFKISNQEELNVLKDLVGNYKVPNGFNPNKNTMFVQVERMGSGQIDLELTDVNIGLNLEFNIEKKYPFPEGADLTQYALTTDTKYCFLTAIVPQVDLIGVNLDDWESPIDVNNGLKEQYVVEITCDNISPTISYKIVNNIINNIGNIIFQTYECSDAYNEGEYYANYTLKTFDKDAYKQLITSINNMNNGMKAVLSDSGIVDISYYEDFQNKIINQVTPYGTIKLSSPNTSKRITEEKGNEIAQLFNADEITLNSYGTLWMELNNFDINQVENKLNLIHQNMDNWNVYSYVIKIYW